MAYGDGDSKPEGSEGADRPVRKSLGDPRWRLEAVQWVTDIFLQTFTTALLQAK